MVVTAADIETHLIVGMEVHVELATRAKMFTSAPNIAHPDFYDAEPNTLLDPVVLGMPGVLPVINRKAVEMAILVGLALNCRIAPITKWDRKSYYYPDLPKNYQISQYDEPLCGEGSLQIPANDQADAPATTVRILRAHLEEDAGKLLHEAPGGIPINHSIVDLNRAGTPLLEIVTYPDLTTPEQVVSFAHRLRQICLHLRVSGAVMQKGHIRFEPNINVSIHKDGMEYRTPIVEIKNLNSFKALEGAVRYEYARQVKQWITTGTVSKPGTKSTRGWDDSRQSTFLQREKEEAHDYRYFPDPDLVPVHVNGEWIEQMRAKLPELPLAREKRYVKQIGLNLATARTIVDDPDFCSLFEEVLAVGGNAQRAATLLLNYGAKRANERGCAIHELGITPVQIQQIAELVSEDKINSTAADALFGCCMDRPDQSAHELASTHNLLQVSDPDALEVMVDQVLTDPDNAKAVTDIRNGKDKAIGALLGKIMKMSKGKANPKMVQDLIRIRIS